MTTLTVKIENKKTEKAVKAILEALGLSYNVGEMKKEITKPQTLKQYNADLENGNSEIERGEFITEIQLKDEVNKW